MNSFSVTQWFHTFTICLEKQLHCRNYLARFVLLRFFHYLFLCCSCGSHGGKLHTTYKSACSKDNCKYLFDVQVKIVRGLQDVNYTSSNPAYHAKAMDLYLGLDLLTYKKKAQ